MSTSLMWSTPSPDMSRMTMPLLRILTRLPDIPLMMGWPTAEPKSLDETPNKSSIVAPMLSEAPLVMLSPSMT